MINEKKESGRNVDRIVDTLNDELVFIDRIILQPLLHGGLFVKGVTAFRATVTALRMRPVLAMGSDLVQVARLSLASWTEFFARTKQRPHQFLHLALVLDGGRAAILRPRFVQQRIQSFDRQRELGARKDTFGVILPPILDPAVDMQAHLLRFGRNRRCFGDDRWGNVCFGGRNGFDRNRNRCFAFGGDT